MRVVVIGGGMQGTACAYDLCRGEGVRDVVIADMDEVRAREASTRVQQALRNAAPQTNTLDQITGKVDRMFRVSDAVVDVTRHSKLVGFLREFDVAVSAVPYFLNPGITRACIETQTHLVDMGGNTDVVFEQRALHDKAKAAGVTILPDCGLAPGLANILAADGIAQFDRPESVAIRVGGLPQYPVPPLNYQLFFSIHGLLNEYLGQAVILQNGKRVAVDTLTDTEILHFDNFDIPLEAAITLGGLSTLPWTYEGRLRSLTYKTIRYPGHWDIIKSMRQLGVFDNTPVKLGNSTVIPRELFAKVAETRLTWQSIRDQGARPDDVVLVRVSVTGEHQHHAQTRTYEIIDYFDPATAFTAMMRTTAFPVSIIAQMLGNKTITERGVLALETVVPTQRFIEELQARQINVTIHTRENAAL